MLDGDDKPRDISSSLFIKQITLIPLFCFIVGGLVAGLAIQVTGWDAAGCIAAALTGTAIGFVFQSRDDRMVESLGRWIWIPPVCIMLLALAWDTSVGQPASFYFYYSGPGLTGVQMFLFTLPAIACCFYAVGITLALRSKKGS
jgi:hypothetical protein